MGDLYSSSVGCHTPGCSEDADHLAYDTMVNLNIGFCDTHADSWRDVGHIEFQEASA